MDSAHRAWAGQLLATAQSSLTPTARRRGARCCSLNAGRSDTGSMARAPFRSSESSKSAADEAWRTSPPPSEAAVEVFASASPSMATRACSARSHGGRRLACDCDPRSTGSTAFCPWLRNTLCPFHQTVPPTPSRCCSILACRLTSPRSSARSPSVAQRHPRG